LGGREKNRPSSNAGVGKCIIQAKWEGDMANQFDCVHPSGKKGCRGGKAGRRGEKVIASLKLEYLEDEKEVTTTKEMGWKFRGWVREAL